LLLFEEKKTRDGDEVIDCRYVGGGGRRGKEGVLVKTGGEQ